MKGKRIVCIVLAALLLLLLCLGRVFAPYDPTEVHMADRMKGPNETYLMGTDQLGRDMLSRILYASTTSTLIAVAVVALSLCAGILIGGTATICGGWVDDVLMRIADLFMAFPSRILIIAIAGLLSASIRSIIIAMLATSWVSYARMVRGSVLTARHQLYADATAVLGGSPAYILLRHILINVFPPILTFGLQRIGSSILMIVGLSYLGLGAQPPTAELGAMLKEANTFLSTNPHMFFYPGLFAAFIVFSFNYIGDYLRDLLDPKRKREALL